MLLDSLGSGDDDEDNGLEDSSAEIENDQVYFSRGVFLLAGPAASVFEKLMQWNFEAESKCSD